jgi:hypothetical protein
MTATIGACRCAGLLVANDMSTGAEAPFCVLHEAHQAVMLSPRSGRPAGSSMNADHVALAMMSAVGEVRREASSSRRYRRTSAAW